MSPYELIFPTSEGELGPALAERGRRRELEVPTLLLVAAIYGGWLTVTLSYGRWPLAVLIPMAILVVTLHSSMQHEIVHGHPTRWHAFNRLLGMVPLSLWLPFERYRQLHRAHHIDARLTDPLDDPESFYWRPEDWERLGGLSRLLLRAQQTLAGRILIGCVWRIGAFLHEEWGALARGQDKLRGVWVEHLLWCVPVIVWLKFVCGMPLWLYFIAIIVPANAIQLIRSFAEHRARPDATQRIAIVENSWILGPLFLFNNLHSLHHEAPLIPWYEYPQRYRTIRERLIAANGGLVYSTYFDVARRYLFRAHDVLEHPMGRIPVPPG
jgi:fatty acid desaturase